MTAMFRVYVRFVKYIMFRSETFNWSNIDSSFLERLFFFFTLLVKLSFIVIFVWFVFGSKNSDITKKKKILIECGFIWGYHASLWICLNIETWFLKNSSEWLPKTANSSLILSLWINSCFEKTAAKNLLLICRSLSPDENTKQLYCSMLLTNNTLVH